MNEQPLSPGTPQRGEPVPNPAVFSELLLLGAIPCVYVILLDVLGRLGLKGQAVIWLRLLVPNGWLLGASGLWFRVRPPATLTLRGGPRAGRMAVVCGGIAVLVLLAPRLWAGPEGTVDASRALQQLLVVLLVPVAEELYFRGLLLDHLARNLGRFAAITLVSALFGFLHFPQGIASTMVLVSIALCVVTLATGSVLWAVALHLGWNAFSAVLRMPDGPWRWGVAGLSAGALAVWMGLGLRTRTQGHAQAAPGFPRTSA